MQMFQSRTQIAASAAALLLVCGRIEGGEPVQIKGSTEVELPKPGRVMMDRNKARQSAPDDERSGLQGGFTPVPLEGSALLTKKAKQELDKRKNWILVNPYETHYDSKTTEFLKGEKGTGLYNNRLMADPDEKTLLEKFMTEKSRGSRDGSSSSRSDDPRATDRGDKADTDSMGGRDSDGGRDTDDRDDRDNRSDDRSSIFRRDPPVLTGASNLKNPPAGERVIFADRPEGVSLGDSPYTDRNRADSSPIEQQKLREQQAAHDQEFTRFLQQPRGGGASLSLSSGLRLDPLNPAADATRQEANPISPGRSDQFLDFGRSSASAPAASSSFGPPGGGSPITASMQNSSLADDFSSKITAARPSFSSPVSGFGAQEVPSFTPSPFQLPFPKRKF